MKKIICAYTNKELKMGDITKRGIIYGHPFWDENSQSYQVCMRGLHTKLFYGRLGCHWETYYISVSNIGKVV